MSDLSVSQLNTALCTSWESTLTTVANLFKRARCKLFLRHLRAFDLKKKRKKNPIHWNILLCNLYQPRSDQSPTGCRAAVHRDSFLFIAHFLYSILSVIVGCNQRPRSNTIKLQVTQRTKIHALAPLLAGKIHNTFEIVNKEGTC